jgi:hypothetical protein
VLPWVSHCSWFLFTLARLLRKWKTLNSRCSPLGDAVVLDLEREFYNSSLTKTLVHRAAQFYTSMHKMTEARWYARSAYLQRSRAHVVRASQSLATKSHPSVHISQHYNTNNRKPCLVDDHHQQITKAFFPFSEPPRTAHARGHTLGCANLCTMIPT